MCERECQCVICEMNRQGVIIPDESEVEQRVMELFKEFEKAGLGS